MGITWDSIVGINRTLCQTQKMEALTNAKNFAAAQARWEGSAQKPMRLVEALTVCRETCDLAAFTFNNGNTFAAVARGLLDESLRSAPAVEAQIIRTTVCHYVAGTVAKKELQQVLEQLAPILEKPAAPVVHEPAEAPAPRLTEARPLA